MENFQLTLISILLILNKIPKLITHIETESQTEFKLFHKSQTLHIFHTIQW